MLRAMTARNLPAPKHLPPPAPRARLRGHGALANRTAAGRNARTVGAAEAGHTTAHRNPGARTLESRCHQCLANGTLKANCDSAHRDKTKTTRIQPDAKAGAIVDDGQMCRETTLL